MLVDLCQPSLRHISHHSHNLPDLKTDTLIRRITGGWQWMRACEDCRKKSQVRAFISASIAFNRAHYSFRLVPLLIFTLRSMWPISGQCMASGRTDLKNDKATNITVDLVGDSLTHLIGTFIGPEDTPYNGGTYEVVSTRAYYDLEHQYRRNTITPLDLHCVGVCDLLSPSTPSLRSNPR